MDTNRSKRRSFSKLKLIRSLYMVAMKPSSAVLQPYGSKPPKPSPTNSALTSAEFAASQPIKQKAQPSSPTAGSSVGYIIVNQEQIYSQQMPKVAFVVTDRNRDSYGRLENLYGGGAAEDEGVDDKAAKYISSVQERFRLC